MRVVLGGHESPGFGLPTRDVEHVTVKKSSKTLKMYFLAFVCSLPRGSLPRGFLPRGTANTAESAQFGKFVQFSQFAQFGRPIQWLGNIATNGMNRLLWHLQCMDSIQEYFSSFVTFYPHLYNYLRTERKPMPPLRILRKTYYLLRLQ